MSPALLIIDVQVALFQSVPRPADAEQTVARINMLARRGRACGVPVVYIQHECAHSGLAPDSPGWALLPDLERGAGDYVLGKTTADAFLGTRLASLLQQLHVSCVTICGYASEFCVDTTVRQAAARGMTFCWRPMRTPRTTSRMPRQKTSGFTTT